LLPSILQGQSRGRNPDNQAPLALFRRNQTAIASSQTGSLGHNVRWRPAPRGSFLGNTRKTECGASELLICLAVRAAPFGFSRALQPTPANRRSELQQLRPPQISTLFTQWEAALDLSTRPTCFSHLGDGLENLAASIATFGWISLNWVVDLPSNQVTVTRNGIRTPATSR